MKKVLLLVSIISYSVIHAQSNYMYYLGSGQKEIIRMDSTGNSEVLLKGQLTGVVNTSFDESEGKVYWVTANEQYARCSDGQLFRSNRDGTEVELVLESSRFYDQYGFGVPIVIDKPNDRLYMLAEQDLFQVRLSTLEITALAPGPSKGDFFLDQKHQQIYYTTYAGVHRYDILTEEPELLFNLPYPGALAVDTIANQLFCTGLVMGEGTSIYHTDLEGNILNTVKSGVTGLENLLIDQEGGYLYWTEQNRIHRSELSGENEEVIWEEATADRLSLTFDPTYREIYWNWRKRGSLWKSDPDLMVPQLVIKYDVGFIHDLLIDESNELIYWVENTGNETINILYADYDLNSKEILSLDQPVFPGQLALDTNADMIYWSDFHDSQIYRASLTDGQVEVWSNEEEARISLQLDSETGQLFWLDFDNASIKKSSLASYNPVTLYTNSSLQRNFGLDRENQKIIWLEYQGNTPVLKSMDFDGSTIEVLPQNEPLSGLFWNVWYNRDKVLLTRPVYTYDIQFSNDNGQHFYTLTPPCQPVRVQIMENFALPNLVNQENLWEASVFQLSPNPASNYVNLIISEESLWGQNFELIFYSSLGKRVASYPIDNANEMLDLSAIPAGLYHVQLVSKNNQLYKSEKIIVLPK